MSLTLCLGQMQSMKKKLKCEQIVLYLSFYINDCKDIPLFLKMISHLRLLFYYKSNIYAYFLLKLHSLRITNKAFQDVLKKYKTFQRWGKKSSCVLI